MGSSRGNFHRKVHLTEARESDAQGDGDEHLDPIDEEQPDQEGDDGELHDGDDDEELVEDDEEAPDFAGLAEVLTLTAKKLSSMTLGRKFTGRPNKTSKGSGKSSGSSSKSAADLKKVTHCSACGALGHWHEDPECPLNAGGGSKTRDKTVPKQNAAPSKTHKVGILHHQHGATEISSPSATSYGNMFSVNVVDQVLHHQVNEVKINGPEGFAGFMVLDTGCQRTCCGKRWCRAHYECLGEFKLHPNMVEFKDSFKFGKGEPSFSKYKGYFPSAISGQPLLLAASVLDEDIPFLASNPLLTELGAVFNLLEDTIVFTRLGGKKAKIQRLGGHMVVCITDFQHESPSTMSVWNDLSQEEVWQDPHPEFVLSYQARPCVADLPHDLADDPATTLLAEGMAAADLRPQECNQGHDRKHDACGPAGPTSSRPTTSSASTPGQCEGESCHLQAREVQEVRQSTWPIRHVPELRDTLDLEQRDKQVGRQDAERGGSWIKRSLCALAAFATAFVGDNRELFTGDPASSLQGQTFGTESKSQDTAFESGTFQVWSGQELVGRRSLDGLRPSEPDLRPPVGRAVPGGMEHRQPGASVLPHSEELCRARLLQRGDLQGAEESYAGAGRSSSLGASHRDGSGGVGGGRGLRLAVGGDFVKPGTAKRMRGQWMKSARLLESEHQTYVTRKSTRDRPPPSVDLWELFAGRALCSELAHQYDLEALQPWDLVYGQDFMSTSTRRVAFKTLDDFRPMLLMLELKCTHYTLFNKNLNYSHRLEEWDELQHEDKPLLDFTSSMANRQADAGRYFFVENPERSELWQTPQMIKLMARAGVFTFVLDAGAFGATIDGKLVIKPLRIVTNFPGLDEVLQRRLSQAEKVSCQPIEGSATKKSQEYPERMCRALLQHLRDHLAESYPSRFCFYAVWAVQMPTQDLGQWDEVVDSVDKSFENTSKRPYYIHINTYLGRKIQDLFRIDAIKIQVVSSPTTRRIPSNVDEYYTRAAFLVFNDDTRAVEVEDLGDLQYPRQRFDRPVRYAVFAYGHRRDLPQQAETSPPTATPTMVPNLPTDIDFPGLSPQVSQEFRAATARLHLNLGHPSRQELCRLLAYEGNLPDAVFECAKKLRCATYERLRPKQPPRPSGMPSLVVGQFGDELQMDVFYCRTLRGETFIALGIVDRATGFQQAIIIPDRSGDSVFQCMEQAWLKPYGLPIHVSCDPDTSFRGSFQERLEALGVHIEHCAAESHWQIGMVERRNALLRTMLEKLIDQFGAVSIDECSTLLAASVHAINSGIHTHGRSAYQAVFGRQPRLANSNFNDPMVLSSSSQVANLDSSNSAAYKAEFVRCEALKTLHELDCSQHLRRALLRKTRATKVADLQPGQPCAYWRWTRRGSKKRGSWKIGRFLSWDPSHVGKQAWLRTGGSTTLVTAEQLRSAFGFEQWSPSEEDVRALKDASTRFDALLDDRGPAPEDLPVEDDDVQEDWDEEIRPDIPPLPPSMMVPVTPPELLAGAPSTPPLQPQLPDQHSSGQQQPPSLPQLHNLQQQQQTINVHIDSPTHITNTQHQQQQFHRYGVVPPPPRRHRSRTPTSKRIGAHTSEQQRHAELPASMTQQPTTPRLEFNEQHAPQTDQQPVSQVSQHEAAQSSRQAEHSSQVGQSQQPDVIEVEGQQPPVIEIDADDAPGPSQPPDPALQPPHFAEPASQPSQMAQDDPYLPQLPQKRPFEAMIALVMEEDGTLTLPRAHWDGSPPLGYGPRPRSCHHAYLTSSQRKEDVEHLGKNPEDSDTSQGSDTSESETEEDSVKKKGDGGPYKQGLSRAELKALDRELPWRKILEMPQSHIDKFIEAINKEADSWSSWQSVEPLNDKDADYILSHPTLKRRVLRSRGCYRDKAVGLGELRAKCRIAALGHLDPDLAKISRSTATPGRLAEHVVYTMICSGHNRNLFGTGKSWASWTGDAATAFLQGDQAERTEPLYLLPPRDGLIALTNKWQHKLYRVRGNIYGLANAPFTWNKEVQKRMKSLSYVQHSFDKQLYYKVVGGEVVSIVLIYVDDFIGLHRQDYPVAELHNLFKWGSLTTMEVGVPTTFKGKELTLHKKSDGEVELKITMEKFIGGLDKGQILRGRLQQPGALTASEQRELRSVSGCLQWAATQARPEIAPIVSLSAHGAEATINDLKALYATIDFLKKTPNHGINIPNVAINQQSLLIGYSDASWANARKSGSQIGTLVGLTSMTALSRPAPMAVLDWRSARSPRICRSTLAAEASAGDEISDRSGYANMFISELLFLQPAHRVGCRLNWVQATDAKSLFDAIIAENPNLSDKRTLVSIRAIQETTSPEQIHWIPTRFQFADGLTKVDEKLRISFTTWLQSPTCILVDHPENEALEERFFGAKTPGQKANKE